MKKLNNLNAYIPKSSGTFSIAHEDVFVHFLSGKFAGSFVKVLSIKTGKQYRSKWSKSPFALPLILKSIKIDWSPKPLTIACNYGGAPNSTFGSNLQFVQDNSLETTIIENELSIKDCFGTEFYIGAIVSYKRLSKQIFASVVDITDNGRIKLQRFFGQTGRQKYDYINFGNANEYLILNEELMDNLTILKLSV